MKNESGEHPNLSVLRKILFWDTDINKIDWHKQYKAIIQRILERGNENEKKKYSGSMAKLEHSNNNWFALHSF